MEEGERNSKFFYSQEKSRQNRKNITSLNVDGKHFNNSVEILNQEAFSMNHYTNQMHVQTPI